MIKILFVILAVVFFTPAAVQAGILDSLGCMVTGNCGLIDIESGFQLLTNWLIGGIGALALLYFIWGASQWITSSGKSNKIEHGREIMIHSVTAIVIALTSYLLVQFFINDVLLGGNPSSEFRVNSECSSAPRNKPCNQPLINYACTGTIEDPAKKQFSNLCITKCEIRNLEGEGRWTCINKNIIKDFTNPQPQTTDECPTDLQVCLNVDSLPDGALLFNNRGEYETGENFPGCCMAGPQQCSTGEERECTGENSQFFTRPCNEINLCLEGFVNQSHGCCVSRVSPVSCEQVSQGDICDPTDYTLIPYRDCSQLEYCL